MSKGGRRCSDNSKQPSVTREKHIIKNIIFSRTGLKINSRNRREKVSRALKDFYSHLAWHLALKKEIVPLTEWFLELREKMSNFRSVRDKKCCC